MLRLTLAQMRRSLGRLTSAGIAIAIGTAFVAATLLAGSVITRTAYDSLAASYADADLVVVGQDVTADVLANVRATPGVAAASARPLAGLQLFAGSRQVYATITATAPHPRLEAQTLVTGVFPTSDGEIALPRPMADRLRVAVGGTVDSIYSAPAPAGAAAAWTETHVRFTVVGLVEDPAGAFAEAGGAVVLAPDQAGAVARDQAAPDAPRYASVTVLVRQGADVTAVQKALSSVTPAGAAVRTKDEQAQIGVAQATGDTSSVTAVVLGFAAIALVVAALVIANTFQVIVAQRTRTLALLRCVGASKAQLRRSVLLEASVLGLGASTVGLLVGIAVVQVALRVLGQMDLGAPLPASATVSITSVLVPLVVGTAVTLVASLAPARAATRVAPLAALRPADAPTIATRASRVRLVVATLLTAVGLALLLGAVAGGRSLGPMAALALGVLGGAVSFVGVLIGAVLWVPQVVGWVGRLLARTGTSAKLAAANTVRNPRRTTATSTALLIGVTLVAMMSTGAASARATLGGELDRAYPVDVAIRSVAVGDAPAGPLSPDVVATVTRVPGVSAVARLTEATLLLTPTSVAGAAAGDVPGESGVTVHGISADDATAAARDAAAVAGLDDHTVVVSRDVAKSLGITDGSEVTLTRPDPDADGRTVARTPPITLRAAVTALSGSEVLVTPRTMSSAADGAPSAVLWVRLGDVNDAATTVPAIQDALSESPVQITGGGVERASFQQIIDTLLAVVVGLLAVAVVIALVGVANTLSLSVIERRRESATLRAIGLGRRQLRWMLAIEGMLIAGIGAVLGVVLGTLYGWAGAAAMLGSVGQVSLAVPWGDLGLVLLVAVVAGLLASVLPGRAASRTSPVAALAVD
jgi:putative ABC transport system permease protein